MRYKSISAAPVACYSYSVFISCILGLSGVGSFWF